jgi:DNA topoisomerase-1
MRAFPAVAAFINAFSKARPRMIHIFLKPEIGAAGRTGCVDTPPAPTTVDRNQRHRLVFARRGREGSGLAALTERLEPADHLETAIGPKEAAEAAGLRYVSDSRPGIRRKKAGKGFCYVQPDGTRLSDGRHLRRIRSLAVPPAWTDVWICPFADGHIQATGRDARRRKQYRYHARFREARESTKYEHLVDFAQALPVIRAKVCRHMSLRGLPREKVLATVVYLLEATLIRVGNDDYARENKSYGLTTLKQRHAAVEGSEVRFRFTGKGGKQWALSVRDRRVAKVIRSCQDLPGQELLQYVDEEGNLQDVSSTHVNAYLREITGEDITAKDFRTWAGTLLAVLVLKEQEAFGSPAQAKRNLRAAIARVAARLGNTPTICRKCYVHPDVLDSYLDGKLTIEIRSNGLDRELAGLQPAEAAVLAFLRGRMQREEKDAPRLRNAGGKAAEISVVA